MNKEQKSSTIYENVRIREGIVKPLQIEKTENESSGDTETVIYGTLPISVGRGTLLLVNGVSTWSFRKYASESFKNEKLELRNSIKH